MHMINKKTENKEISHNIDIFIKDTELDDTPNQDKLYSWAQKALNYIDNDNLYDISITVVSKDEIQRLNNQYREKNKPTNVLSFPSDISDLVSTERKILGDVILCCSIINQEAKTYEQDIDTHWAHILIHGVLHLLGYDHKEDQDAVKMESVEKNILNLIKF